MSAGLGQGVGGVYEASRQVEAITRGEHGIEQGLLGSPRRHLISDIAPGLVGHWIGEHRSVYPPTLPPRDLQDEDVVCVS
jgi:hypothetical protein